LKLLYILSEYLPESGGGIISHYARILPGLAARGHEVTVLLASKDKLDQCDYEIDGVRVQPLKAKFLEPYANRFARWAGLDIFYYMLPVAWAAWSQAQEDFYYDVVEATDWALLFLPWVAAEKRAPVVVSLHGSCGQVDWFGKCEPRLLDGDLVRMVEAAALRGADVVHANSRANAEFWQEKTGREIRVIPPAYGGGTKADLTTDSTDKLGLQKGIATPGEPELALSFQNPFTSELAQDSENTSPTRSAIGPAGAICADDRGIESVGGNQLADSAGFLAGQSQAGLPMDNQKLPYIRTANDLIASGEFSASVPIREIRGFHSAPLDAPGLVVGRLQNWKGAEVLCKALRLAPEIEIEWVGGDTDWRTSGMKASEYLAANYPDVFGKKLHWIGRLDREKVAEKMQVAGFLVVPSLWDVFNLTVSEGMEAGLPVICSKAAGAEMLIGHGFSGFLFDPAKPEELADSLKLVTGMSEAERVKMGLNSQDAVKTRLDEGKILNLLEGSYGDAIKRGVTGSKDAWLEALLSAGPEQLAPLQLNLAQRAIRKAGRILSYV
jgi:glycosyltransferase involved in cell wall biosynthesis